MSKDIVQLCDQVRETAYAIHVFHGHGHLEKVYENALAHRLRKVGLDVKQQQPIQVFDEDGTLIGDNVDGVGFVRGLEAQGHRVRDASIWLVGLGGAGGGIAAALCEAGVGRLLVTEIQDARASKGIDRLLHHYPDVPVAEVRSPPKGIHIAINATPLGLRPEDPQSFDPMTLDPDTVVADVIMSPAETPLLQRARTHGRRIHHGRHMLDHQVPLYLEWFGIDTKGIDIVRLVRSIG